MKNKYFLSFVLSLCLLFGSVSTVYADVVNVYHDKIYYRYDNTGWTEFDVENLDTPVYESKRIMLRYYFNFSSALSKGTYDITFHVRYEPDHSSGIIYTPTSSSWFYDSLGNNVWSGAATSAIEKGKNEWFIRYEGITFTNTMERVCFDFYPVSNVTSEATFPLVDIDVVKVDTTANSVSGILGFVQSIWQGITDLPSNITSGLSAFFSNVVNAVSNLPNALKGFFDNIVTSITNMVTALKDKLTSVLTGIVNKLTELGNFIIDGLKGLFIPSDDYFANYFDDLYDFFSSKLGFLLYPFELMADLLNAYLSIGEGSGKIVINDVVLFDTVIIKATTFDLKGAISTALGSYYNIYYAFVDCIVLFMFVNFGKRKFDSIVGGTGA